ncbi:MAG: class I SAM-dependent methyltransferase [Planctomycetes bacterium]|jgi:SAM-dependent methyltransferase|nr:class I SAM-dependent methyltransferase [Planctomycetota bacterium]
MTLARTAQEQKWLGEHGKKYSAGWVLEPRQLDELWMQRVTGGVSRTAIVKGMLEDIPRDALVLEVGCNVGNQLVLLRSLGFTRVWGLELIPEAAERARQRVGNRVTTGSALSMPFEDNGGFDVIMTCWCLSHIAPADIARAGSEIRRLARKYIFCTENYAPTENCTIKDYLWQRDHRKLWPDCKEIRHEIYPSAKPHPGAPSHQKGCTHAFLLEVPAKEAEKPASV